VFNFCFHYEEWSIFCCCFILAYFLSVQLRKHTLRFFCRPYILGMYVFYIELGILLVQRNRVVAWKKAFTLFALVVGIWEVKNISPVQTILFKWFKFANLKRKPDVLWKFYLHRAHRPPAYNDRKKQDFFSCKEHCFRLRLRLWFRFGTSCCM